MERGIIKGEICNRSGCTGIIDEHEKEGCCSCHVNPPCSYCTTDTAYCPLCDWHSGDAIDKTDPEIEKKNREYYANEAEKRRQQRDCFYSAFNSKEPSTEELNRSELHTHFTMLKLGTFIPGTKTRQLLEQSIKGTFGGRFEFFDGKLGKFMYIAYTD